MQANLPSHPFYNHNGGTVARRGWLAGLLLRRPQLLARFAAQYQRLKQLPRRIRRQLQRRIALGLAGTALLLAFSHVSTRAANISVVNGEVAVYDNGICSLIEAIRNANNGVDGIAHDDCAAGEPGGPDTITLPAGGNFTVLDSYLNIYESETGLAPIRSRITIEGNGATIARDAAAGAKFRLLAVAATGHLTINQVTLNGGYAYYYDPGYGYYGGDAIPGEGGAIFNAGNLTITNSTVHNNTAGHGGGVFNDRTMNVTNSVLYGNRALGRGNNLYDSALGGGIANDNGSVTISESTIRDNQAMREDGGRGDGGGLSNLGGTVLFMDSVISGNEANGRGGGVYTQNAPYGNNATLIITNSIVSGNSTLEGGGVFNGYRSVARINTSTLEANRANRAGGLFNDGSLTIRNSTITGNQAVVGDGRYDGQGGGVVNDGTLTIIGSTLDGNQARFGGGLLNAVGTTAVSTSTFERNIAITGGGAFVSGGQMTIVSSTLSGNTADEGGGAFVRSGSYLTIANSTLTGNSGRIIGGGAISNDGEFVLTNSTLHHNNAYLGGGIYNSGFSLNVTNSTLSGNVAEYGGGVYSRSDGSYDRVSFARALISGNTATTGREVFISLGPNLRLNVDNYNMFGFGGDAGVYGFIPGASDLVPARSLAAILDTTLRDNGGATQTLALPADSPAIDAAPSDDCQVETAVNGVDQRGLPRNDDGDGRMSANECDIGAFELQSDLPTIHVNNLPFVTR
jgi:hypothetical protein